MPNWTPISSNFALNHTTSARLLIVKVGAEAPGAGEADTSMISGFVRRISFESAADQTALKNLIDRTLGNLDNAMDSILRVRAEVGARMNSADSAGRLHQDVAVVSKDLLSKLQNVDYTQAISQLDMQSFVLQAAQQSYARISGLSLFNSL